VIVFLVILSGYQAGGIEFNHSDCGGGTWDQHYVMTCENDDFKCSICFSYGSIITTDNIFIIEDDVMLRPYDT